MTLFRELSYNNKGSFPSLRHWDYDYSTRGRVDAIVTHTHALNDLVRTSDSLSPAAITITFYWQDFVVYSS
jgi:hypothetical protein